MNNMPPPIDSSRYLDTFVIFAGATAARPQAYKLIHNVDMIFFLQ